MPLSQLFPRLYVLPATAWSRLLVAKVDEETPPFGDTSLEKRSTAGGMSQSRYNNTYGTGTISIPNLGGHEWTRDARTA